MTEHPRRLRGRPRLDDSGTDDSPRVAVRLSHRAHRKLIQRAEEQERSVSDAVRSAVAAWSAGPTAVERVEIRRLVRLSDRERERIFLNSNENLRRLIELAAP